MAINFALMDGCSRVVLRSVLRLKRSPVMRKIKRDVGSLPKVTEIRRHVSLIKTAMKGAYVSVNGREAGSV